MTSSESIASRLSRVADRIRAAERAAHRPTGSVRLVGASKMMPVQVLREAYLAGLRDFGENYVQELDVKAAALADLQDLRFHVIGHLQRNKARVAVRHASTVQTVSSQRLVAELGKRARAHPVPEPRRFPAGGTTFTDLPVCLEVNVAREAQKSGCDPDDVSGLLDAVAAEDGVTAIGLMTIPPAEGDPRPFFDALAELRERHGGAACLPELSMGMSGDLEAAIQAGATMVRVGTALFGPRPRRDE